MPTQIMGVLYFSCLDHEFQRLSPCLGEGKVFPDKPNLVNSVVVQILHEHSK